MNDGIFSQVYKPAVLALADGSIFSGFSVGAIGMAVGEVVFNTSMTGYQEILTDPSYASQIVTLTYPHIGNTGVNQLDMESPQAWVSGLVIREMSPIVSNWRADESLPAFLKKQKVVAIAGVDTRRLTRLLRDRGAQAGCIMTGNIDADQAVVKARQFAGLVGANLVAEVSRSKQATWQIEPGLADWLPMGQQGQGKRVVVYDFGVKQQILNLLACRGYEVVVVPADTKADKVMKLEPHAVFLSNGPGDPAACGDAIESTRALLDADIPVIGICLGCQLLALACGASTMKMKFGHHGGNHPVSREDGSVAITSQNHGFAVDESTLPPELEITHRSLFDGTIQGIRHKHKKAWAFQGHPEAGPGPHDLGDFFDVIATMI